MFTFDRNFKKRIFIVQIQVDVDVGISSYVNSINNSHYITQNTVSSYIHYLIRTPLRSHVFFVGPKSNEHSGIWYISLIQDANIYSGQLYRDMLLKLYMRLKLKLKQNTVILTSRKECANAPIENYIKTPRSIILKFHMNVCNNLVGCTVI